MLAPRTFFILWAIVCVGDKDFAEGMRLAWWVPGDPAVVLMKVSETVSMIFPSYSVQRERCGRMTRSCRFVFL